MIFDQEIDVEHAKFWCVFVGEEYNKLKTKIKNASKNDKKGITNAKAAVAASILSKTKGSQQNEVNEDDIYDLNQNFIDSYQKDHPNASLDDVMKAAMSKKAYAPGNMTPDEIALHDKAKDIKFDDSYGILTDNRSFGQQFKSNCKEVFVDQKLALALAGTVPAGFVVNSALGAAAVGGTSALATGATSLAHTTFVTVPTAVGAAVVSNPEKAAGAVAAYEIRARYKKWAKEHPDIANRIEEFGSWIAGLGASVGTFAIKNPLTFTGACAIAYGLFKTKDKWIPYVKGLAYKAFNDNYLACCKFKCNDNEYSYEYRLDKGEWVLLDGNAIASAEDTNSFLQTDFSKKFRMRCSNAVRHFYNNPAFAKSIMEFGDEKSSKLVELMENNRAKIEKTFCLSKMASYQTNYR